MGPFARVIFWVLPVAVAAAVATSVARFTGDRAFGPVLVRARWLWVGAGSVVGGIAASFAGFGAAWTASLDGRSETPGMVLFATGWYAIFGGAGVLAGRAIRYVRAERRNRHEAGASTRRVRRLAAAALLSFLAGHVCVVLYSGEVVHGNTRALVVALLYPLALVACLMLGFLALRAGGRPRAAVVLLFAAPGPILGFFLLTVMFWQSPGIYPVTAAMAVATARLALWLWFQDGKPRRVVKAA